MSSHNKAKMNIPRLFIICILLLSLFSIAEAKQSEKVLFITLNYKDNSLNLADVSSGKGFIPVFSESEYCEKMNFDKASISVYSKYNELLYSSYFYIENKRFEDTINETTGEFSGGITELNDFEFVVIAPYSSDTDRIEITSGYDNVVIDSVGKKYGSLKGMNIPTANEGKKSKGLFVQIIEIINSITYYILK